MKDPDYRRKYDNMNARTHSALLSRRNARTQGNTTIYTIPIVFHIMHKGEPLGYGVNLPDEKVFAAVKQLNERFRKIPGSVGDGNSVDMQIQFALAVRDPNGNATTGIDRYDMSGYQDYMDHGINNPGMDEYQLKLLSGWDTHYYANVWVVSNAYDFGGFAYYPSQHGNVYDGVTITPGLLNGPNFSSIAHEFGHYFNLIHTFGDGDGSCSPDNDCSIEGDQVCDTPKQVIYAPCEYTPNPCMPGEFLAAVNYMSYSCNQEFTQGQKERALDAVTIRSSLLRENGNMALVPVGIPAPDFSLARNGHCISAGSDVQLLDRTSGIPNVFNNSWQTESVSFVWVITNHDDITQTYTDQNPVFTVPVEGNYDVTLTVTTPQGTYSLTKPGFLVVEGQVPPAPNCPIFAGGTVDYLIRTDDIGIREVVLNDLHHVSGTSVEDAAAGITDMEGYADFSCDQITTLDADTDYTISVRVSDFESEHVHVYIDYDNNGFTGDDLAAYSHDIPAGSGLFPITFRTSANPVANIRLRMRIVDVANSEPIPEACGFIGYYGQAHDYSVLFIDTNMPPVANDDGVSVNEDHVAIIRVADNDTDADGTILGSVDFDLITPYPQQRAVTPEGSWSYAPGNIVSFTPNPDFNGVATIQYTVVDNKFAVSLPATITVTVTPVNDPPSFTKGPDEAVDEDSGSKAVSDWATSFSPGPPDEFSQAMTVITTNDNPALFSVQPVISASGNLIYMPSPNAFGHATVTVELKDNGGTANGGMDAYSQAFTIKVNSVNDPPVIVNFNTTTLQGVSLSGDFSIGDSDPDGSITYKTIPVAGPEHGVMIIQPQGAFTYTPTEKFSGTEVILIEACDDGVPVLCATKRITIQIQPVTGLESDLPVSIYPNPTTGEFRLDVPPEWKGGTISVSDLFGRIVYESNVNGDVDGEKIIDLSHYVRGMYVLSVKGINTTYMARIILN